jgi:cytochrome c biogenesis protein CcdA
MLLFLLAYLSGVLTRANPCILPVLPFVFARVDRPFLRSGVPVLVGMAVTIAAVATFAAVAGGWAVTANQFGRFAAMVLLALFGLPLLFPSVSARLMGRKRCGCDQCLWLTSIIERGRRSHLDAGAHA